MTLHFRVDEAICVPGEGWCTGQLTVDDCPMRGQPCDTGLLGRCMASFYDCDDDGNVEYEPLRGPMPEICTGRDDSCGGRVANIGDTVDDLHSR